MTERADAGAHTRGGTAASAAGVSPGWDCHVHVFDADAPALPGHYKPAHHPLAHIEAQAATLGAGHLVLVQPSVYGSDNSLLLRALQVQPGRHRGVVVLAGGEDANTDAATLDPLHAAGVRGARLNAVSPVGEAADLSTRFNQLAPLLAARGWHLQWYTPPERLPEIAALHTRSPVVAVLDHLAGLHAGITSDHPAWAALQSLADSGAWVKLSGWYRLRAAAPYTPLLPLVQRVADLFGDHLVWGSDWPHTSFQPDQLPRYASTWGPVPAALGAARAAGLHAAAARLYR